MEHVVSGTELVIEQNVYQSMLLTEQELDCASVTSWLCAWVAQKIDVGFELVHPHLPLTSYGLNSVEVVHLLTALEQLCGVSIDEEMLWELGNIENISAYLVSKADAQYVDLSLYSDVEGTL